MFSFGVCELDDYEVKGRLPFRNLRAELRRKRISMKLLRLDDAPSETAITVYSRIMRELMFGNGTSRTTWRGRFADLDRALIALLEQRFASDAKLLAADWAAADRLTSTELAVALFARFPHASLAASDLTDFLVEIIDSNGTTVIQDPQGHSLQVIRPPFVVRLQPPESWLVPLNRIVAKRALARLTSHRLEIPRAWLDSEEESFSIPPFTVRKISLVHPEAKRLAQQDSRFTMERHSVFTPMDRPADVIRSMNIFNRSYFPVERLSEGARAVHASLKMGGLWIVGRTAEDRHTATIFEKRENGFRVVERFGGGSEIEEIALSAG